MLRGSSDSSRSASNASRGLLALAALCLVPARAAAADARDDVKSACAQAYESSQVLRRQGHLIDARKSLQICARDDCPAFVRTDCANWIDDVDEALPSIVVHAEAERRELADVTVLVDGNVLAQRLDGKAIAVDPGPHQFRFESPPFPAVEVTLVVREGEHYRSVPVTFPPRTEAPAPRMARPVPLTAWVFAGVALAATASFAGWGIAGYDKKQSLQGQCAPFCARSEVDTVQRDYLAADLSLAVAAVSFGLASYFYFTRPELPVRAGLAPSPSGVVLRISGDF